MNRQLQLLALGMAALALAGGGFAAGMTVGPALGGIGAFASPSPVSASAQARRVIAGAGTAASAAGQPVAGRVISVGEGSITVEVRQPGADTARSVIALAGSSTRVVRTAEQEIALGDIKAGDQVFVVGPTDQATGTISASAIVVGVSSLQQLFGGGTPGATPGGGRRGASPTPSPRAP